MQKRIILLLFMILTFGIILGTAAEMKVGGPIAQGVITVAAIGGDYSKLSDALASITDASSSKRYLIKVFGNIAETQPIIAKSSVDVIGFAADIVSNFDSAVGIPAIDFDSVTNAHWRNITARRRGDFYTTANKPVAHFRGSTDRTVRIEDCQFLNEIDMALDFCTGISITGSAEPTLIRCVAQGAALSSGGRAGDAARGIYIALDNPEATPYLEDCAAIAGGGPYSPAITTSGSPILKGCVFISGRQPGFGGLSGGFWSQGGFPILKDCTAIWEANAPNMSGPGFLFSSGGMMNGCASLVPMNQFSWVYTSANNGRFQPFSGHAYQIVDIFVSVTTATADGTILDIGDSVGGNEIASAIPIDSIGVKRFTFNRSLLAADGYLYATPSGAVNDGTFTISYLVTKVTMSGTGNGLYVETNNFVRVSNSNFMSTGQSAACYINVPDVEYVKINNCHFEALDPNNQYAITAASPLSGAYIENCTFVGALNNITLREASKDATFTGDGH
jgi:hypothetical protein